MPSNHINACSADEEQDDDNVAVYAMEEEKFVSNGNLSFCQQNLNNRDGRFKKS
jgi:hypothetical protein